MRAAYVENLNFLSAEIQRHAIPEGLIRKPGFLLLGRDFFPLHQIEQIAPIVFVPDLQHVRVGDVALRVVVVKRGGHQYAHRLPNGIGNRFSLGSRDRLGIQGVEDHDSLVGGDDPAVVRGGTVDVVAWNDLSQGARRRLGEYRDAAEE